MNYIEFRDKNNGNFVEITGSANAKNQCVDLANAYIRDVLKLPIVEWTNAQDFPKKCLPPNYEWIKNDPNNAKQIPSQGDVMIFESTDGVGHISIFDNGKVGENSFVSFDQNWPLKSAPKLISHTYTGKYKVVGWLRARTQEDTNMTDDQKRALAVLEQYKIIAKHGNLEGAANSAVSAATDLPTKIVQIGILETKVAKLESDSQLFEEKLTELEGKIAINMKTVSSLQKELKTANEQVSIAIEQLGIKTTESSKYRKLYEGYNNMTGWELISIGLSKLFIKKSNAK